MNTLLSSQEIRALAELIGRPTSQAEMLWAQGTLNKLLQEAIAREEATEPEAIKNIRAKLKEQGHEAV